MHENYESRKNDEGNASGVQRTDYIEFVKKHRITLDYMLNFGNAVERAKAETLIELAEGA